PHGGRAMGATDGPRWRRGWRWRVVLFFVLGLALVDVAVRSRARLWGRYDNHIYDKRLICCRQRPRDVVIVGGSPCPDGGDPGPLGGGRWQGRPAEDAFNAGLPLGTTAEVWHLVEHGLPAPPRLLVYGITATDLNDSRLEPQGPRELMTTADVVAWARARPRE